jgi:type IV pilus assembly protein PilP
MKSHFPALLTLLALLTLFGCTKDRAELDAYIKEVNGREAPPLEPIPPMKPFIVHIWPEDILLRDPFRSGEQLGAEEEGVAATDAPDPLAPDMTRVKEPLEAFPLDSLDMVGTMGMGKDYFGLIKDPDGVVHRVQVSNWLGQNFGRVLSIAEDRIDLQETVKDSNGRYELRPQSISLEDNNTN